MVRGRRCTREQDLAVLYAKLAHKEQLTIKHPAVVMLAKAMNRTKASIMMRKGNFDSLDHSIPRTGLSHPAKLTADVWAEYDRRDPAETFVKALRAYSNLTRTS